MHRFDRNHDPIERLARLWGHHVRHEDRTLEDPETWPPSIAWTLALPPYRTVPDSSSGADTAAERTPTPGVQGPADETDSVSRPTLDQRDAA